MTDIANAVLDGTDAVMLSAETAVGRHPVSAVKVLERVIGVTEDHVTPDGAGNPSPDGESTIDNAIGRYACRLAERVRAKAIVVQSASAGTVACISRFRPRVPIVGLGSAPDEGHALLMLSGVLPLHAPQAKPGSRVSHALQRLVEWGYASRGDRAVVVAGDADCDPRGAALCSIALAGL